MNNFTYILKQISAYTDNKAIVSTIYEEHKDMLKNGCVYEEYSTYTIRLDLKNLCAYVYATNPEGIDYDEFLQMVEEISNKPCQHSYTSDDWHILSEDYQISFASEGYDFFGSQDNNLFVEMDEDGKITLTRSKFYEEGEGKGLYTKIAPIITNVEKLFLPDFENCSNQLLKEEFLSIMDKDYQEVIRKGERGMWDYEDGETT